MDWELLLLIVLLLHSIFYSMPTCVLRLLIQAQSPAAVVHMSKIAKNFVVVFSNPTPLETVFVKTDIPIGMKP